MNATEPKGSMVDRQIRIDAFRPTDAEGIAALFQAVYGDGYPVKVYYDPRALIEANETGDLYGIVASNSAGSVVGAVHLFRSAPFKALYEIGSGLVLKGYRNLGINKRLLGFIMEEWIHTNKLVEAVWGEAVCNHVHMLKAQTYFGYIETALEIALMPAEAYEAEQSATSRVATQVAFRSYRPKPHRVYLPATYERELRFIYSKLDDQREFATADNVLPTEGLSEIKMAYSDFAQVVRVTVHHVGADFETRMDDLDGEALGKGAVVNQIWLNLGSPWVAAAVDILRDRGYFIGGVFPRWFDQDGLFMQKLLCPPEFEEIKLASDRGRELLEMIRQDWGRANDHM